MGAGRSLGLQVHSHAGPPHPQEGPVMSEPSCPGALHRARTEEVCRRWGAGGNWRMNKMVIDIAETEEAPREAGCPRIREVWVLRAGKGEGVKRSPRPLSQHLEAQAMPFSCDEASGGAGQRPSLGTCASRSALCFFFKKNMFFFH